MRWALALLILTSCQSAPRPSGHWNSYDYTHPLRTTKARHYWGGLPVRCQPSLQLYCLDKTGRVKT